MEIYFQFWNFYLFKLKKIYISNKLNSIYIQFENNFADNLFTQSIIFCQHLLQWYFLWLVLNYKRSWKLMPSCLPVAIPQSYIFKAASHRSVSVSSWHLVAISRDWDTFGSSAPNAILANSTDASMLVFLFSIYKMKHDQN